MSVLIIVNVFLPATLIIHRAEAHTKPSECAPAPVKTSKSNLFRGYFSIKPTHPLSRRAAAARLWYMTLTSQGAISHRAAPWPQRRGQPFNSTVTPRVRTCLYHPHDDKKKNDWNTEARFSRRCFVLYHGRPVWSARPHLWGFVSCNLIGGN